MHLDSSRDRLKILFVTSHWPLAEAYGAQQRVLNLARLLNRFGDVSFVIVTPEHEDEETVRRTRRECKVRGVIRPLPIVPLHRNRLSERLRHEFDPTYMATDPYVVSDHDREWLQKVIQQYDVVWVHTIRTVNWFRIHRWPNSVLDVDDLPSSQHQSASQSASDLSTRLGELRRYWIWRRRERILPERFDLLTVCSENDRRRLGGPAGFLLCPMVLIPLSRALSQIRSSSRGLVSLGIAHSSPMKMGPGGSSKMCGRSSSANFHVRNSA